MGSRYTTAAEMCFKSINYSVSVVILLWTCGYLSDVFSFETTTELPCKGEAALVCLNMVTQADRRKALTSAFSKNHEIDLIFIICNTTECTKAYAPVITFIQRIVALVSTQYDSYIDKDRMHVAIIVYDNTSTRQTLNDIVEQIPKVGNCEFDKFLDSRTESSEARGGRHDGLLKESLDKAKEIFGQSARPNARKILWLFSECGYCENSDKNYSVKSAADDIKRAYGDNVAVFTAGISQCPLGWFHTLAQENTMKTIASTNSSHYACIESWKGFTDKEIDSGLCFIQATASFHSF